MLVRATQPGLMLSGMTSTRDVGEAGACTSRRLGPHAPVAAGVGGGVLAGGSSATSGVSSCAPSTTNAAPGLISNSSCPAGSAIGLRSQACAAIGWPSSSAPTVVRIEVCTNRPATRDDRSAVAVHGDLPDAVAGGVGGGDRVAVGAEHRDFGQPRRLELVKAQRIAVDDVFPVEQADGDGIGDLGVSGSRSATRPPRSSRTCGPSPRLTATTVGWAGNVDRLRTRRSPATSVGRGRVSVSVGAVLCCTTRCGAVHAVAGSPSVAAYAEPRMSSGSESPLALVVFGSAIRSASLGPCRGRTHTSGVTGTGFGTVSVRLKLTGSSGASAIDAAQRMLSGA